MKEKKYISILLIRTTSCRRQTVKVIFVHLDIDYK